MAKIRTDVLADGTRRYRFTLNVGRHPVTNARQQRTYTFTKMKDARAELGRLTGAVANGTFVDRWDGTVNDLCDESLKSATFGKAANTRASYRDALRIPRERLGTRKARSITRQDIETHIRDYMLREGRVRGGTRGTGLSARSVKLTISRLSAAFEQAIADGKLARNPCAHVQLPAQDRTSRPTWSGDQMRAFLAGSAGDRLHAVWFLSACGLRRGEVAGLKWDAVDLAAGTVTIGLARVLVDGKVITKRPKTENGYRTLPLPRVLGEDGRPGKGDMVAALRALHKRQAAEKLAAGAAYEDSGFVAADELGVPVFPEWITDEFHRIAAAAGCPRIRLHDARHTANSLMAAAGVPVHIRAAYCGHTIAVNETTYTHARDEDLALARDALSAAYG